jgi:hypothetical protein
MTIADMTLLMSEAEARACVAAIRSHLDGARALLLGLYRREGWRALGYASWRECATAEFGQSQAYLYRQLRAAEIERELSPMGELGAIPERQLRPLAALDTPELRREAWERAAEEGAVTVARVEAAVDEILRRPMRWRASSGTVEWFTPAHIVERALALLGSLDLDPCSNGGPEPNLPARAHYTAEDDGLGLPWIGKVLLNPPYGRSIGDWLAKLRSEYLAGNVPEALALVPASPGVGWWRENLEDCWVCFVAGRLRFVSPEGDGQSANFDSAIAYLGPRPEAFAREFAEVGAIYRPAGAEDAA